jgi:hypothetical protein
MSNEEKLENKILRRMYVTSYTRFEASKRLKKINFMSFISTTIASLGLILIPLLDLSKVNQSFDDTTLTCFQLFLAVSVLVYSSSISTANYQIRAKEFLDCADRIKNLITILEVKILKKEEINFLEIESEYRAILNHSENHEDIDYIKGEALYTKAINKGLNRDQKHETKKTLWKFWTHTKDKIKIYSPFLCLMILEMSFILDMTGTKILRFLHHA